MFGLTKKVFGTAQDRILRRYERIVSQVNTWDERYKSLSNEELRANTEEFRRRFREGTDTLESLLPEAYGTVKNVCRRLSGTQVSVSGYRQSWDMIPYDVQILGAIAMHHGNIAEMQTGEGKTVTATMPLYLNALSGKPVHLVTVNDYLAQRDCEWVGCILRWLGLTTASLTNGIPPHERKALYACDVVYGTASEFGFDYLRDNSMAMQADDQCQRGHYFAIIDEIDSILIDEARTPLIISGPAPVSRQLYDEIKGGVNLLVRSQRDLCAQLASVARKELADLAVLEESGAPIRFEKEEQRRFDEALRKLWLVSRGTPRNKIFKRIRENPELRDRLDKVDLYYHSDSNKEERIKALGELYIIVDERANEFELTDKGIHLWAEEASGHQDDFTMLDLAEEYGLIDDDEHLDKEAQLKAKIRVREEDAARKERAHNLQQMLRAHLLMERDVDYMVHEGKIVIVDANTGRPQPGRRFSDGLHQAIEAKEGVKIQRETQTYATITLQNLFRLYEKLSGMTGTATTEAGEFREIYKLDVLEIPTYRSCQRKVFNDQIYMTEREKYNAILGQVKEIHGKGRPILIGTESVDQSEKLSRVFKINGLPHTILNAKYHDKEAEIIASAGQREAITIATNMAGRGTDIKLGEGIAGLGGLHVIGVSRHQSRRIDRQLEGRCARLGDPGSSIFYVSFEDPLMRLFASPRINALLKRLRPPEGEPIEAKILNRSIRTAQERVRQRNSAVRKQTLEYDDVMNRQRQEIYLFRNDVLHAKSVDAIARELLREVCEGIAGQYLRNRTQEGGWDPVGYQHWLQEHFPLSFKEGRFDDEFLQFDEIVNIAEETLLEAFDQKMRAQRERLDLANVPEGVATEDVASQTVRDLMIRSIDRLWQEHLRETDQLRAEVAFRTVGQRDPLIEFKHEAFQLFDALSHELRTRIASDLFRFEIMPIQAGYLQGLFSQMRLETERSLLPNPEEASDPLPQNEEERPESPTTEPKIGRNESCPCGSGKKFKKCCGLSENSNFQTA